MTSILKIAILLVLLLCSRAHAAYSLIGNLPAVFDDGAGFRVTDEDPLAVSFITPSTEFYVAKVSLRLTDYLTTNGETDISFRLDDGAGAPSEERFAAVTSLETSDSGTFTIDFFPASTLVLAANTKYWLVLATPGNQFTWVADNSATTPTGTADFGEYARNPSNTGWGPRNVQMGFDISGVPEPSAYGVATGALLFALIILHRKRSTTAG